MKKLNKKGFTLVELLAVIVILALLMVVAFSAIPDVQENARQKAYSSEATKIASKVIEDYQMKQIDPNKTTYTYGGKNIVKETTGTDVVEFTEKTFTMYASIVDGAVKDYCIEESNGKTGSDKKIIGSLDNTSNEYKQGKACNGTKSAS